MEVAPLPEEREVAARAGEAVGADDANAKAAVVPYDDAAAPYASAEDSAHAAGTSAVDTAADTDTDDYADTPVDAGTLHTWAVHTAARMAADRNADKGKAVRSPLPAAGNSLTIEGEAARAEAGH